MRNISCILRRELGAYFTGPIGYVYLIAFILFTNLLGIFFLNPFFVFPVADMRYYMHILAGVSTILVAAITMRLWAEERKENTFEMLLTFPMKARELVLGKFLASLIFYVIALLGTLTVPLMMIVVSRPDEKNGAGGGASFWGLLDPGPVLSGYIGALLLGAVLISFGMFISGLCRDQVVAFVIAAPTLFSAYLLGIGSIQTQLNSLLSPLGENLGSWIGNFVGILTHYDNLASGLLAVGDVLFFVIWTVVFLVLNALGIERRYRKGSNWFYAGAIVVLLLIGAASNLIILNLAGRGMSLARYDMTQDKIYTISPASVEILKGLKDVVTVKYFVSRKDKMPSKPEYQALERNVRDKLEALRRASNNKLIIKIENTLDPANVLVNPFEKEQDEEKKKSREMRLLKKIQPFYEQVQRGDKLESQYVYSALEISYKEMESKVIPQIRPLILPKLEYLLISEIYRMTRKKPPVIALVAPTTDINMAPRMIEMLRRMGQPIPRTDDPYEVLQYMLQAEKYDVRRVKLTKQEPLPQDYDVLVIINPKGFNERQQYEISRALALGKPVFLAGHRYEWNCRMGQRGGTVTRNDLKPNVNPILLGTGISLDADVLMDESNVPVTFGGNPLGGGQTWTLPMHIVVKSGTMNLQHPITRRLPSLFYMWGSAWRLDEELLKKNNISSTILIRSSKRSWTRGTGSQLLATDIKPPTAAKDMQTRILAVLLEGKFKYAFAGKPRPEWPPEQPRPGQMPPRPPPPESPDPGDPEEIKDGKLIVYGCATTFKKNFLQGDPTAVVFFLNCIDYLALGKRGLDIMSLREKEAKPRQIGKLSKRQSAFWKTAQFIPLVVIVAIGLAVWALRLRRRRVYLEKVSN